MTLAKVTSVELSVPATSTSRAVLAADAVVAPVPPLAIDSVPVNELVGKAAEYPFGHSFYRRPEDASLPNSDGVHEVLKQEDCCS